MSKERELKKFGNEIVPGDVILLWDRDPNYGTMVAVPHLILSMRFADNNNGYMVLVLTSDGAEENYLSYNTRYECLVTC